MSTTNGGWRAEGRRLFDRAKRWAAYLASGMFIMFVSLTAFVVVHRAAGVPPGEAMGAFVVWGLATLLLIRYVGTLAFRA